MVVLPEPLVGAAIRKLDFMGTKIPKKTEIAMWLVT
jgi:hypothetical protein